MKTDQDQIERNRQEWLRRQRLDDYLVLLLIGLLLAALWALGYLVTQL